MYMYELYIVLSLPLLPLPPLFSFLCLPLSLSLFLFSSFLLLQTGNSKGQLKVFNVSTGKAVKGGNSKTAGSVLSLALESSGGVVWASDSKGSMFSFLMDSVSGRLQRLKR